MNDAYIIKKHPRKNRRRLSFKCSPRTGDVEVQEPDDPLIESINMKFIYKIERNSYRSKYYLIRKFLPHQQSGTYHIEDSDLGIVSKLLNYADALVYCAQLNREELES